MQKKGKKSLKEYRAKIWTFRQCLQVFVWDLWEKEHKKFFRKLWIDADYDCNWRYAYTDSANVIWVKWYNLDTLVHELVHFVLYNANVIWYWPKEEAPAYIYEEAFTKILMQAEWKFKLSNDIKEFYSDN